MPIYDYRCDHCGHVFSAVQSYSDATLDKCPSCGKRPRKLMATPAIVFKGGGWYKTDSRPAQKDVAKEGAPAAKAETKPKDTSPTAADAKAPEAKPAADAKSGSSKTEPASS